VLSVVDSFNQLYGELGWCSVWCSNNVLHAMAIHPGGRRSRSLKDFVSRLAGLQQKDGTWKGRPFYQTLHGLSFIGSAASARQLRAAIPALARRQRADGTWGNHTFLVMRALNMAGMWKRFGWR